MNIKRMVVAATFASSAVCGSCAHAQEVHAVIISELTGAGAKSGMSFKNGVELALKEINASGGVLHRKLDFEVLDSQSTPGTARTLAQKAVTGGAYVVFGPTMPDSAMVSMKETERAGIPSFVGAESAPITQQGNPYVFRTSFMEMTSMPKVVQYMKDTLKAKSVAVLWVSDDFGKEGHDAILTALAQQGLEVAADISTNPGQSDFSAAVLKVKQSSADAVFAYANAEASGRLLRELRKQGVAKPIVGEATLTEQKVAELAGDAANGVVAHVGLSPDAPNALVKSFAERYAKAYHVKPDANSIKGYTAAYIVKTATEKVGKFDSIALASALHGMKLSAKQTPGVLLDVSYDDKGDLDRESYMVKVVNGKQEVFQTIPLSGAK